MKIVKDKNNVVVFAGDDLNLTEKGLISSGYKASFCTTKEHTIESVGSIPDDWQGGHYTYKGGVWARTPLGEIKYQENQQLQKKAEKETINIEREATIKTGMSYLFPDGHTGTIDIKDMGDKGSRDIALVLGLSLYALDVYVQAIKKALADNGIQLNLPDVKFLYRDAENKSYALTVDQTLEMGRAFGAWLSNLYSASWDRKDHLK